MQHGYVVTFFSVTGSENLSGTGFAQQPFERLIAATP
jgi:hypothetical protein